MVIAETVVLVAVLIGLMAVVVHAIRSGGPPERRHLDRECEQARAEALAQDGQMGQP